MQEISGSKKSGRSTGTVTSLLLLALGCPSWVGCAAPISTMRSPYHLRTVEVRNDTDQSRILKIEPTASQHLGAATTFTGVLRPGEVKTVYLYHGFEYEFRILDAGGYDQLTQRVIQADRDSGLVFSRDSLRPEIVPAADPGRLETFSDSLQAADPFGLRAGGRIQPDTARGQSTPTGARQAIERERAGKLQTGTIP